MRLSIRERFACFSIDNKNYRFCFRLYSQICLIIQANVRFQGMHLKNVYKSGGIRIGIDIVAKLWKVFNESSASVKYQRRLAYSLARYSSFFTPFFSSSNHFWYIKSSISSRSNPVTHVLPKQREIPGPAKKFIPTR